MNLFRLIAFALLIWIAWFMIRNYLAKQKKAGEGSAGKRIPGKIVKCRECDVHLPEADAVRDGDEWFCSQSHHRAWLDRA